MDGIGVGLHPMAMQHNVLVVAETKLSSCSLSRKDAYLDTPKGATELTFA
jgi:hypothetical protein